MGLIKDAALTFLGFKGVQTANSIRSIDNTLKQIAHELVERQKDPLDGISDTNFRRSAGLSPLKGRRVVNGRYV